ALMIEFFGNLKQSGYLASLEEKYIGHIGAFDYVDTRAFILLFPLGLLSNSSWYGNCVCQDYWLRR
uniref:hypothetical protein n=1 Tax=Vibrio cholerae TaxID=666 RepID=UPI001C3E2020